jgi:hypothetical protein
LAAPLTFQDEIDIFLKKFMKIINGFKKRGNNNLTKKTSHPSA